MSNVQKKDMIVILKLVKLVAFICRGIVAKLISAFQVKTGKSLLFVLVYWRRLELEWTLFLRESYLLPEADIAIRKLQRGIAISLQILGGGSISADYILTVNNSTSSAISSRIRWTHNFLWSWVPKQPKFGLLCVPWWDFQKNKSIIDSRPWSRTFITLGIQQYLDQCFIHRLLAPDHLFCYSELLLLACYYIVFLLD